MRPIETIGGMILLGALLLGVSAGCASARKEGQIELLVTEKGFEPSTIRVKKDEPVTLVITRKTDNTCAKEIVIEEEQITRQLPLNEAVTVTFTPKKTGEIKYACGMKMLGGVLRVE